MQLAGQPLGLLEHLVAVLHPIQIIMETAQVAIRADAECQQHGQRESEP